LFVKIVKELIKTRPNLKAAIVGWGKEMDKISKLIFNEKLEDCIELVGSQKDISKYLTVSKVFLLTSRFEGLPISALEAMVHRLPVISTNYPGSRELIKDGVTGYVCGNKKDFINKLNSLLNNEKVRREMGEKASDWVIKYHSRDNLEAFVDSLNIR
jgi:glycosyltransferase involved in cell wall biosynthesis